jgi:hypothetical protein
MPGPEATKNAPSGMTSLMIDSSWRTNPLEAMSSTVTERNRGIRGMALAGGGARHCSTESVLQNFSDFVSLEKTIALNTAPTISNRLNSLQLILPSKPLLKALSLKLFFSQLTV